MINKKDENQTGINQFNESNQDTNVLDIKNRKIQKCIQIDHPNVYESLNGGFESFEEALESFKTGNYEILNHCDRADTWDVYDSIQTGIYKAFSLDDLNNEWDLLAEIYSEYYLVKFEEKSEI
jgi:hypothetical protein